MSVLMDDDPEGTLRLEGQVVDSNEEGVDGAIVILSANPPRVARTETDGSFYFDKLVSRRYELQARAAEGVAGPLTARLTAESEPVVLRLKPAGAVEVTVIDAAEKSPIAAANVELRGLDMQSASTDGDGKARVTPVVPGRYRLVASAPGYAKQHSSLRVSAQSGAAASARLALRRGAPVSGKVVGPDGKPVANAKVLYAGASEWAQQADPRHDAVRTDTDGTFRFDALPAGSFRFTARHKDFAPGSSELTTLDGSTEVEEIEIVMAPAAVIRGKVVSKEGEGMDSARVRVAVKMDGFFRQRPRQAFTDENGAFEIGGLPRKELELVAMHDIGSSELASVDMTQPPHERELTLTLELTDAIAGIVIDTEGEPVEGVQVSAVPDWRRMGRIDRGSWRLRGFSSELTDAGGRFTIRGLSTGPYTLRASPPGSAGGGWRNSFRREPVPAETGDTNVEIILEADGAIEGKVAFADGDPPELFSISTGGFGGGTSFSTKDGSFRLDDLPPRTYSLTIRGFEFDTRQVPEIEVKPGQTKDLGTITVRQGRFIAGRVTQNGQPVAEAMVRAGSNLFGDGTSAKAERGGPPGARTAKETTTDDEGFFRINGMAEGNVFVVAEHPELGRSKALAIPRTGGPVPGLELTIEPYGALQGKVTKGSVAADSVVVSAQSQTAYGVQYGVRTGSDGSYRFDNLAPDTYKVSAMTGMPFTGMGFHSQTVAVSSGQTTTANLTIEQGPISLTVTLQPTNADEYTVALVYPSQGNVTAKTYGELQTTMAAMGDSDSSFVISFAQRPTVVENLMPGAYTVCAVPYPNELGAGGRRGDFFAYSEREGDRLPVFCQPMTLSEAATEQSIAIPIKIPKYVPPPEDDPTQPDENVQN